MTKNKKIFLNVIIVLSVLLLISILLITFFLANKQHTKIFNVLPITLFLFGVIITSFAYAVTKSAYQVFIGLSFCAIGIFTFLLIAHIIPFSILEWWPIIGVITSVVLFISGYYQYKRIKAGFFLPSVLIFIFSAFLFLFSFKILPFSFRKVVIIGGPLLIAFWGGFLIAFYFVQKKYKKFILKEDGPSQFEDDEIIPEKK